MQPCGSRPRVFRPSAPIGRWRSQRPFHRPCALCVILCLDSVVCHLTIINCAVLRWIKTAIRVIYNLLITYQLKRRKFYRESVI